MKVFNGLKTKRRYSVSKDVGGSTNIKSDITCFVGMGISSATFTSVYRLQPIGLIIICKIKLWFAKIVNKLCRQFSKNIIF